MAERQEIVSRRGRRCRRRRRPSWLVVGLLWMLAGFCLGRATSARSVDLDAPAAADTSPVVSSASAVAPPVISIVPTVSSEKDAPTTAPAESASSPTEPAQSPAEPAPSPTEPAAAPAEGTPPQAYRQETGDIHAGELVLVSNGAPFVFPENQELSCVLEGKNSCYLVRDRTVLLAPAALEALNRMMEAFAAQGGPKVVNVVAGHRTKSFQQHLFDQSAERNGLEHAQRYVSQPGGSEHHTGYALDFSLFFPDGTSDTFDGTGDCRWIAEHAAEYGFVLRYPEDKEAVTGIAPESWHYRYVGQPHATVMTDQSLCLEEYLEFLQQYPWEGEHLHTEAAGQSWEIYYCPEDALMVPKAGAYTVSGDNLGGFIVSVPSNE